MQGLWGNFWFRTVVVVAIALPIAILALWITPYIAVGLGAAFGIKGISQDVSFAFRPSMFLAALPLLPFWLLAEPRLWGRRAPLPFASYLTFVVVFFLVLFLSLFVLVQYGLTDPMLNLGILFGCYLGAALLAGGAGYGYYRFWRRRQDRRPPVIPDVF
ncbi:hypothetical protein [Asticcacaulis sp. 201]|uniref:hypothetical protein n=1 Tax=Asticcacaulis sp. 201 TaxID=3028787 RepID=UPI0029160EB8|nr:hypothetical protein [Asticcacaulis sp. 201]MDV6330190.1 hypothetical protein [Asticcacaulis sp. 201]